MPPVLVRFLGLHAPDEILERGDGLSPGLALLALLHVEVFQRGLPVHAQERRQEIRDRILLDAAFDLGLRHHCRDLLAIAAVDFLGGRLDVGFGGLFFLGKERLEVVAELVEDREIVGEAVENAMDDRIDLAIERIFLTHRRRPAETGFGECVDEQARGMTLLGEERAIQHGGFQHRNLKAREQCLDAVRQVLGLEDEIEQHRNQLDRHRLELIGLSSKRGVLQIAQHVVRALRNPRELDERAATEIEARLACLQPREPLAERGRRHDRRARDVAGRGGREGARRDVAPGGPHVDLREFAARAGRSVEHSRRRHAHGRAARGHWVPGRWIVGCAARRGVLRRRYRLSREHAPEKRHHVDFGRRRLRNGRMQPRGLRRRGAGAVGRTAAVEDRGAPRDDAQTGQVLVEVGINAAEVGERSLIDLLQDRELDPVLAFDRVEGPRERFDDRGRSQRILGRLEVRPPEQLTDPSIERLQLVEAVILDDARDVAGDDRFVHCRGVDQRELGDVDFRKVGLVGGLPRDAVVDPRAHAPLEFAHQRRSLQLQHVARAVVDLLLVAHVGPGRAVHQHVGNLVDQCRERKQHAMNGEIPAVRQNLRHLARYRPMSGRFGGWCAHPRSAAAVASAARPSGAEAPANPPSGPPQSRNLRTKNR